ncbi:MAG: mannose-1-phosphate guanyltransferase [Helicobacteraceae bacterium 4484_230]|nr:MAG: mannose-1-phosphate guanyltransferase [Helicobacteraceae bacterium 4484_230]
MKAVVMAGGFGTRIQPLTNSRPKPMLPIINRPMMEHTMLTLRDLGIKDFIVLLYFKPEIIKEHFGDGSEFGINITYVVPDDDYGTAGAVKLAQEYIGDDNFIIISGDLVTDFDFQKIFDYHKKKNAKLSITLTSVDNPLEFGVVIANEEGRIEKFLEKPSWGEVFSDTINTGIYVIEPEILEYIPKGENFDFAKDLFPLLMHEGIELIAGNATGYWRDVGNPESYREVYDDILNEKVNFKIQGVEQRHPDGVLYSPTGYELDKSIEIIGKVVLGNNVEIANGCRLKNVVIGDNVKIGEDCKLANSVLWNDILIERGGIFDGCVICNDNVIGKNVKAKAGMILAQGCEIGQLASIEKDVTIWPDKVIAEAAIVSNSVVLGSKYKNSIFENGTVVGQSNVELSCEMAAKLAEAFGSQLPIGSTILIARDHHYSSRMLKRAFLGGMLSAGVNVFDIKSMPSSVLRYHLSRESSLSAGVYFRQKLDDPTSTIVTFYNSEALKINNDTSKKIEKAFFKETFRRVEYTKIGRISESHHFEECLSYCDAIKDQLTQRLFQCIDCRIAVDMMHGTASDVFPKILNDLKVDHIMFNAYSDVDKLSNIKTLAKRSNTDVGAVVKSLGLNAGFILYPFGQRLDIVCDDGILLGKESALLVVLSLMNMNKDKRQKVFLPTWAPDMIPFDNLDIERGKYADFKAEKLKEYDLVATGEGNFAFTEFAVHRDSMYATLKITEMISQSKVDLSEIIKGIKNFYYSSTQVECTQALKGRMMRKFLEDAKDKKSSSLDGVKIWLDENDWILMIPDQYGDYLNLYVQAVDEEKGVAILEQYKEKIKEWSL